MLEELMTSLFGSVSPLGQISPYVIPIVGIVFVFSIPIIAIVTEYYEKRNKARLLERALEKGVDVENLTLDEPKIRLPYRSGMVTVAAGVGIIIATAVIGIIAAHFEEVVEGGAIAIGVFVGIGAIVAIIGGALLWNDRMNIERLRQQNGRDA
jgi:MFS-type transporter involved in bile tolerance (Atg22 family)